MVVVCGEGGRRKREGVYGDGVAERVSIHPDEMGCPPSDTCPASFSVRAGHCSHFVWDYASFSEQVQHSSCVPWLSAYLSQGPTEFSCFRRRGLSGLHIEFQAWDDLCFASVEPLQLACNTVLRLPRCMPLMYVATRLIHAFPRFGPRCSFFVWIVTFGIRLKLSFGQCRTRSMGKMATVSSSSNEMASLAAFAMTSTTTDPLCLHHPKKSRDLGYLVIVQFVEQVATEVFNCVYFTSDRNRSSMTSLDSVPVLGGEIPGTWHASQLTSTSSSDFTHLG